MKKVLIGILCLLLLVLGVSPYFLGMYIEDVHEDVPVKMAELYPMMTFEYKQLNRGFFTSEYEYTIANKDGSHVINSEKLVYSMVLHHGPLPFSALGDEHAPFTFAAATSGKPIDFASNDIPLRSNEPMTIIYTLFGDAEMRWAPETVDIVEVEDNEDGEQDKVAQKDQPLGAVNAEPEQSTSLNENKIGSIKNAQFYLKGDTLKPKGELIIAFDVLEISTSSYKKERWSINNLDLKSKFFEKTAADKFGPMSDLVMTIDYVAFEEVSAEAGAATQKALDDKNPKTFLWKNIKMTGEGNQVGTIGEVTMTSDALVINDIDQAQASQDQGEQNQEGQFIDTEVQEIIKVNNVNLQFDWDKTFTTIEANAVPNFTINADFNDLKVTDPDTGFSADNIGYTMNFERAAEVSNVNMKYEANNLKSKAGNYKTVNIPAQMVGLSTAAADELVALMDASEKALQQEDYEKYMQLNNQLDEVAYQLITEKTQFMFNGVTVEHTNGETAKVDLNVKLADSAKVEQLAQQPLMLMTALLVDANMNVPQAFLDSVIHDVVTLDTANSDLTPEELNEQIQQAQTELKQKLAAFEQMGYTKLNNGVYETKLDYRNMQLNINGTPVPLGALMGQ